MKRSFNETHLVYDMEHGNKPEFISGNYYNFHELKREHAKQPKSGKVSVTKPCKSERLRRHIAKHPDDVAVIAALEILDDEREKRRAKRQATRQAARQAVQREQSLRLAEHKPKRVQTAARNTLDLLSTYDKVTHAYGSVYATA